MDFQRGDEVTVKGTVDYVGPDHVTVIFRGVGGSLFPLHVSASQVQGSEPRGTPTGREAGQPEHGRLPGGGVPGDRPQGGSVARTQPKQ